MSEDSLGGVHRRAPHRSSFSVSGNLLGSVPRSPPGRARLTVSYSTPEALIGLLDVSFAVYIALPHRVGRSHGLREMKAVSGVCSGRLRRLLLRVRGPSLPSRALDALDALLIQTGRGLRGAISAPEGNSARPHRHHSKRTGGNISVLVDEDSGIQSGNPCPCRPPPIGLDSAFRLACGHRIRVDRKSWRGALPGRKNFEHSASRACPACSALFLEEFIMFGCVSFYRLLPQSGNSRRRGRTPTAARNQPVDRLLCLPPWAYKRITPLLGRRHAAVILEPLVRRPSFAVFCRASSSPRCRFEDQACEHRHELI